MLNESLVSVVEDDASLRQAVVSLLHSHSYLARGFASADEYLNIRDGDCGCVIADIHMPGTSGLDLIGRLRALGVDVPVILITARGGTTVEREARQQGAFCLLAKPFESGALIDCVDRALAS